MCKIATTRDELAQHMSHGGTLKIIPKQDDVIRSRVFVCPHLHFSLPSILHSFYYLQSPCLPSLPDILSIIIESEFCSASSASLGSSLASSADASAWTILHLPLLPQTLSLCSSQELHAPSLFPLSQIIHLNGFQKDSIIFQNSHVFFSHLPPKDQVGPPPW